MKKCPTCERRFPDNVLRCPEDGTEVVEFDLEAGYEPPEDLVGRRMFGDYVVEKKLGEGGMGAVYLAKHSSIDQSLAIKVLHGHAAENSELVQRFNREAKAIARLTHPNIIRVFVFGHTQEGLIYLAMELVEGGSLRELLERHGRLSERHAIFILRQALSALAEAHDIGIIHRDLKPDNILLTEYRGNPEFVKVVDFGIAKVSEPDGEPEVQLTQAGVVYGTPEYLSPEQAQAKKLDGRSDLYSLGVILWELVTGKVPFEANTAMAVLVQHVYEAPGDPRAINPALSDHMVAILDKVLAKDPNHRFQTADELLAALEQCDQALEAGGRGLDAGDQPAIFKSSVWNPSPALTAHAGQWPYTRMTPEALGVMPAPAAPSPANRVAAFALIVGILLLLGVGAAIAYLITTR